MITKERMKPGEALAIADTLHREHPHEQVEAAEQSLFWHIEICDKHGDYVPQSYRWAHEALTDYLRPMKRTFASFGGEAA